MSLIVVYVDGACLQNHDPRGSRKAGYGVWFNHGHPWNEYGPVRGVEPTNSNAEIEAVIRAVNICGQKGHRRIEIRTDSNFVVQSVEEFFPKWKANNWRKADGKPVTNVEKFKELDHAIKYWNMDIRWRHVPGHQGVEGNVKADELARRGANEY